ncbi:hypothetical protein M758_1G199500 [Ceratodon purpureus]|uniref:Secreted protein n=1 Tax=Ceratodon purpureus TaxID=3225 RepID=A0A8T0J9X6_CERPU|nr:hypothetical protein KC19_1G221300 [Ceratodon purpureus]KAG0630718.1 hypothetical protein M758_1G199500 [Ceratodon purpureus]
MRMGFAWVWFFSSWVTQYCLRWFPAVNKFTANGVLHVIFSGGLLHVDNTEDLFIRIVWSLWSELWPQFSDCSYSGMTE